MAFDIKKGLGGPATRIVIAQFGAAIVAFLVCMGVGWVPAYSALLGGLTCAIPSAFMAWRFMRETAQPRDAFANLVRGEVGKLLLTITMFIVIFLSVKPIALTYFFVTLVVGFLCNLFVPLAEQLHNRNAPDTKGAKD